MAEQFWGRVVRIELDGTGCRSKERVLDTMLTEMDGVNAHYFDSESKTLTAYVDESLADEVALVRALVASGLFPVRTSGLIDGYEGDERVC